MGLRPTWVARIDNPTLCDWRSHEFIFWEKQVMGVTRRVYMILPTLEKVQYSLVSKAGWLCLNVFGGLTTRCRPVGYSEQTRSYEFTIGHGIWVVGILKVAYERDTRVWLISSTWGGNLKGTKYELDSWVKLVCAKL
jgi:hypothetical protein